MSFGNDSFSSEGQVLETQTPNPSNQLALNALRPEEVEFYKKCTRELYLKIGLPFAIGMELLASRFSKKPAVEAVGTKALFIKGFRFLANMFFGSLLGTPLCYSKLAEMRAEYIKSHPEFASQNVLKPERAQPLTQSKDLGYPAQVPNPDDLESSFSSDFSSTSKPIFDDPENIKTPKTTYQELRARHRGGSEGFRRPPSTVEPPPPPPPKIGTYSTIEEKPLFDEPPPPSSPRVVKKTKYGDEME